MNQIVISTFCAVLLAFSVNAFGQEKSVEDRQPEVRPEPLRIVFLAGRPSHGYGAHEHYAGCKLLAERLKLAIPELQTEVFKYEWPEDDSVFEECDAIVMYCDGGPNHPANKHLQQLEKLAQRGVGIVCLHYGVEVPSGDSGDRFLDWIGGYFEENWSVNPHWTASFESFPEHPISRGVVPFAIHDEWYFHMRFRPELEGVTPILTALAPDETMARADGPHSGNPFVRKEVAEQVPQHLAWAFERPGGGRGFGFTGGHDHWNWGDGNFRKIVLNAIVWTAGGEVPENGLSDTQPDSVEEALVELMQNQDYEEPEKYDWETAKSRITITKEDNK